jgi:hypothetical protein
MRASGLAQATQSGEGNLMNLVIRRQEYPRALIGYAPASGVIYFSIPPEILKWEGYFNDFTT